MVLQEILVFLVNNQKTITKWYFMFWFIGREGIKGERGDYGLAGRPGPMGETADAEKGDRGADGKKSIVHLIYSKIVIL
jgi:hypothetical protein